MRRFSTLAGALATALCTTIATAGPKVVIPSGVPVPAGYARIADYGAFGLYRAGSDGRPADQRLRLLVDADLLQLDRLRLDTQRDAIAVPAGFARARPQGAALQLIQFVGPLKGEWLDLVRGTGSVPVHAIASHGYLVWADGAARTRLAALAEQSRVVQFSEPLPSFVKLGDSLFERLTAARDAGAGRLPIVVQRYRHADGDANDRAIEALDVRITGAWTALLGYENAHAEATLAQVRALIELPDVYWVGERHERTLADEVQAQIVRGAFEPQPVLPSSAGYLPWLDGLGFPADSAAYPIIDITDDGIDNRTTSPVDASLRVLGLSTNPGRLAYNQHCGSANTNGAVRGHGHINASIAVGYDLRANATTPGARFPGEYQRGLGINPYGRLGGTRIFNANGSYDVSACGASDTSVIRTSYIAGARISSNSWGCRLCGVQYDDSSQAYDVATRDADLQAAGNQALVTVFAAGNNGPAVASVWAPGNAKNVITVGASENPRPNDENGPWSNAVCHTTPADADHAMDVAALSSRGPVPGQRNKPDLVAPGTHITGTRPSVGPTFGVCDPSRPIGNATYMASSGTSHATPAVASAAALAWRWIAQPRSGLVVDGDPSPDPSPAVLKAWLVAHPTYLDGSGANDDLPSPAQGYGMPNLSAMFDETPKRLVDQNHVFDESGEVWTWKGRVADPSRPLRVVLVWTDAPGAIGTSPQVNDLDLEIETADATWLGNHFKGAWSVSGGAADARNSVEAVFLPPGHSGPLAVRVRAFDIAGDGVPGNDDASDQDFALVCVNCVTDSPDAVFIDGFDPTRFH
jgi:hypothetical protein